ncbi:hypothetical protein [Luminiphilus sp. nBUS_07]|uniref:hypothetical protein n=1 Tax=Luminiphilus sp. nBUS_07 TaxID=3395314 RepID=UPI003EB7D36E
MKLSRRNGSPKLIYPQQGAYTIFFVAILGLLTLLAVRSMTTSTADSVRLTTNTHSSSEAFLAAEEAMASGMEWLAVAGNTYTSALWPNSARQVGSPMSFPVVNMGGLNGNRDYTMSFGFEVDPDGGPLIKVVGRAVNGVQQSATVSQWVSLNTLLQPTALDAPLMISGCLSNVTGTPDIFSQKDSGTDYVTLSRGSTYSASNSNCPTSYGTLNNGGGSTQSAEAINVVVNSGGDLWNQIFTETRDWFEENVDNLANVHLIDATSGDVPFGSNGFTWSALSLFGGGTGFNNQAINNGAWFGNSYGTLDDPAIVVIRGCPGNDMLARAAGNDIGSNGYKFVGLVFIEAASNPEAGTLQCDASGWHRLKVLGTLVINGDMTKLGRQPEIISAERGGITTSAFPVSGVYASAGSWTIQGD